MKNIGNSCWICGCTLLDQINPDYCRCRSCGQERLIRERGVSEIINDVLDETHLEQVSGLDRFKNRLLRKCARSNSLLIDIGSASGRFLYQNRSVFTHSLGIEVTMDCVNFSRKLGLEVLTELPDLNVRISAVTFWHSLEHIPIEVIQKILPKLQSSSDESTAVIVSVPNAHSWQYRLLRAHFAYYDVPHHLHQFTPRSLDQLFAQFGYVRNQAFGSFSYASFGWLQGLLNLFNFRHNYVYYRKKRGWDFGLTPRNRRLMDSYNVVLMVFLLVPSLLMALYDLLFPARAGVVTFCYRPRLKQTIQMS